MTDKTHPLFVRPEGLAHADTCPHCASEWSVSLEHSDSKIVLFHGRKTLSTQLSFMCYECSYCWWQCIHAEIGAVIKNDVVLEDGTALT